MQSILQRPCFTPEKTSKGPAGQRQGLWDCIMHSVLEVCFFQRCFKAVCLCSAPPPPFPETPDTTNPEPWGEECRGICIAFLPSFSPVASFQLSWIHQDIYQWPLCFPFQFLNFTALTSLPLSWSAYALKLTLDSLLKWSFRSEWTCVCVYPIHLLYFC